MVYFIPSCVLLPGLSDVGIFLDFGKARHLALIRKLLLFPGMLRGFLGSTWRGKVSNRQCFKSIRGVPLSWVPKSRAVVPAEAWAPAAWLVLFKDIFGLFCEGYDASDEIDIEVEISVEETEPEEVSIWLTGWLVDCDGPGKPDRHLSPGVVERYLLPTSYQPTNPQLFPHACQR